MAKSGHDNTKKKKDSATAGSGHRYMDLAIPRPDPVTAETFFLKALPDLATTGFGQGTTKHDLQRPARQQLAQLEE